VRADARVWRREKSGPNTGQVGKGISEFSFEFVKRSQNSRHYISGLIAAPTQAEQVHGRAGAIGGRGSYPVMYRPFLILQHAREQSVGIPRCDQAGPLTQERFSPVRLTRH